MNVVLKTAGDPRGLIPTVRAVLKEIDPQKPAHGLYPLEDLIGATYARERQAMVALLVFAGTAIFLAVLSVYGVLSRRVGSAHGRSASGWPWAPIPQGWWAGSPSLPFA